MTAKHCATFTDALLPVAVEMLEGAFDQRPTVFDPFAGTGKGVDYLRASGFVAFGVELEPEFIGSEFVTQGDALALPYADGGFDACFTSPVYGNRMADKDLRPSVAGTYAKSLGRIASPGSSCHLQWGEAYRVFHIQAWREVRRVLKPGGVFLLNIKDHVRNGSVVPVSDWHVLTLKGLGFRLERSLNIPTPSLRRGQNGDARVNGEWLHLMRKAA